MAAEPTIQFMGMYNYDQLPDLVTNRGKEHRMRRGVYKADGQLSIKTLIAWSGGRPRKAAVHLYYG